MTDILKRHWFQIILGYCAVWLVAGLMALLARSDTAAIISAVGSLGFNLVCGGLILLDMHVPSLRRWLR